MQDADAIVFVIDDDSSIREAIKSLVSLVGLRVETFGSAQEFLRYDPADPTWLNRDRFVLSNGHSSMLLYAMLHLAEVHRVDKQGNITTIAGSGDFGGFSGDGGPARCAQFPVSRPRPL